MVAHTSFTQMFRSRVRKSGDMEAFSYPENGKFTPLTWAQVGARVDSWARGLRALGFEDGQCTGLVCSTRVEWMFADLAINCAGGATTTVYPSTTAEDTQYILSDSDSVFVFAETQEHVTKLVAQRENLPKIKHVIALFGETSEGGWVIGIKDLEAKGDARATELPAELDDIEARLTPESLATLIYTSGTTGRPKGVELPHDCWMYIGEAIKETNVLSPSDRQFLWLPLSHSFGKCLQAIAVHVNIPTAVDGRIDQIVPNLSIVRPTFMAAAPRIFEKVYNKVINGAREAGGLKLAIFKWAVGVGKQVSKIKQGGKEPGGLLGLQYKLADKLVFSKLRAKFGDNVRFFISGSAPLNRDIAEFFHAAGLLILEGYGLTESSAASFLNLPGANKFGTVGAPLPGTEVKIAGDGEILFRGRGVMRGYHNMPEVSAETLQDGWLYTGDIGEITAEGMLKITDRKKDLIKTSGGKYVAPQALEGQFKAICPYASEMLVHGNQRNFCSALVTLDEETLMKWAAENELGGKSYAEVTADAKVHALVEEYITTLNAGLARYETIKKFAVLPQEFTQEGGELTPSLKVKRKVVEAKYKTILDGFYEGAFAEI